MTINVTPIPKLTTLVAPAFTLGTTNTAGAAITAVASDSTILTYDTTLPDAITFGQSGAVGTATTASRRDHAHAMDTAVYGRVARSAGNVSTTSTTLVLLTGATVTFTTGANAIAYGAIQSGENNGANTQNYNIDIDDSLELGTLGLGTRMTTNLEMNLSFAGQSAELSAGAHTIELHWSVSGGTGLTYATSTRIHMFWAHEIP